MRFIQGLGMVFLVLNLLSVSFAEEKDVRADENREIAELILQLGAKDFKTRKKAEAALIAMGSKAIPELKKNVNSDDPEIKMRVVDLLSKMEVEGLKDLLSKKVKMKGFADDSARSVVWPCLMEIKDFNDKTGEFKGQIEWTSLDAIHEIKGKLSEDKLVFTETKYIKRGNAILGCVYTFDLKEEANKKGKKIIGKWISSSSGGSGKVELEWE